MCLLLQSQGVNTFSGQFVLRQGALAISTMVGHCALDLATSLRTVLQNFRPIQPRHYWIKKEKAGQGKCSGGGKEN